MPDDPTYLLFSPDAALANQRLDGKGFSLSSSAGYRIDLGNNWFVEPSAGIIYSNVKVDTLNMPGGFGNGNNPFFLPPGTVQFDNIESILGRFGVRVGTSVKAGDLNLQPFASASVWHEAVPRYARRKEPYAALEKPRTRAV